MAKQGSIFCGSSDHGLSRRGFLGAACAATAGTFAADMTRLDGLKNPLLAGEVKRQQKSVILLWMAGGPSHIDTWDPKPDRPYMNRGPFGVTQTKQPGVFISEHLPKQAAMLDQFSIIR